jgi:hypothetical protein
MQKRRYEILLPLKHNDGRPVSGEVFEQTREDLIAQFGGVTLNPQTILGFWVSEGVRFEDDLLRLIVDADDSAENRRFFESFKQTLLERFEQVEIYIASYPVDIL